MTDWFENCIKIIEKDIKEREERVDDLQQKIKTCPDPKERETLVKLRDIQLETLEGLRPKLLKAKTMI